MAQTPPRRAHLIERRHVLIGIGAAAAAGTQGCAARTIRQVRVGGADLAYVEAGVGEPLVMIHGGLQDYRFWRSQMDRFAPTHRVIAYSRRNHFPNPTAADGLPDGATDAHAEDLAVFLRAIGVPDAHIVAHSAGAHAALFFASRFPEMVRTLCLNEPPVGALLSDAIGGPGVLRDFTASLEPARVAFRRGNLDLGVRLFADAVGGTGAFDRRSAAFRQMMRDNVLAHVADAVSPRPRPRFTRAMGAAIRAPVLLTTGEHSPPFFHAVANELQRSLRDVRRMQIRGSSHTVPIENEAAYARAVHPFLASHVQRRVR